MDNLDDLLESLNNLWRSNTFKIIIYIKNSFINKQKICELNSFDINNFIIYEKGKHL